MLNYHILSTYTITVLVFIMSSFYFFKVYIYGPKLVLQYWESSLYHRDSQQRNTWGGKEATADLTFNSLLRYMAKLFFIDLSVFMN